jgi:hypothetical protein
VLRWAIVFTSLTYAYLLFRKIGIGVTISVAGAVVCLSQQGFLDDIERLHVVSVPLILAVLYHGLMVWKGVCGSKENGLEPGSRAQRR